MSTQRERAFDPLRTIAVVRRRLSTAHVLEACAAGLATGAVSGVLARAGGWTLAPAALTLGIVSCAAALSWFIARRGHRTLRAAADRLERALPESRNVIFTAVELTRHPERAPAWMRSRVFDDAGRMIAGLEPSGIISIRARTAACALAAAVAIAALFSVDRRTPPTSGSVPSDVSQSATHGGQLAIVVTLEPPSHAGLPAGAMTQPRRINAVEATRLTVRISGPAEPSRIRFGNSALRGRSEAGTTIAQMTLRESGYLAIESAHRSVLIPVAVTPDRAPAVKIEKPGRDLLIPRAASAVAVEAIATDDFGLDMLALRYTKVSGSGEQFEFVEGELPLAIARHDRRSWSGRGALPLSRLGLEAGDSLVYRVVARDARPGDPGLASSETFFVEIAAPGQSPLEGFEMPPDRERHALSQQMIVVKIRRLREQQRAMAREELEQRTGAIGAEQRAVRANFVFLMGGHVEDEEEEAEQSHEVQEGRLENTSGREISRAIGHMTRVEQTLAAVDTATALEQARLAVDALQRAFGRNRYILRTLPVASRINPSRRLTGTLEEARDSTRQIPTVSDPKADAIRELLASIVANAEQLTTPGTTGALAAITRLTEQALAIDPVDAGWQSMSVRLIALRDAVVAGSDRETLERKLQEALTPLLVQARRVATRRPVDLGATGALHGAWAEALKRK
jgi:hypothetical protein